MELPEDAEGIEEIQVVRLPEPEEPEDGVIDPDDTHVEGVDADEAGK
jgi:hypothetical protein